jgi:glycosyltransferase 2 family protein
VALEPLALKWIKAVAISTAAAAALYLVTVLWAGRVEVGAALKMVSVDLTFGLLALSALNYGLRFLRWHYYLRALGSGIAIRHNLRIYIGGFALTTTPGKAGEMARSLWLRPYGVPVAASVAAFLAERMQDFLAVVLLSSLGASMYPGGQWLLLFSFALVLLSMLIIYVRAISRWVLRLMSGRSGSIRALGLRIAQVLDFTRNCLTARRFTLGLALGIGAWSAEAYAFALLLQALGQPLPLATAIAIYALSMLAGAVSFMPGGLGGSEATMIVLLTLCKVPVALAVSATLLIRVTTLWFAVLLGIAALSIRSKIPAPTTAPAGPAPLDSR